EWGALLRIGARNRTQHNFVPLIRFRFVSKRRLILKTCGSTRLLAALPTTIQLANDYEGFDQVVSVYYSRKNFLRPELQPEEHRSFDAEVEYLDSFFQDGHALLHGITQAVPLVSLHLPCTSASHKTSC
ncbi:hypothetical protein ANCCAN_28802, partial [Ancylostoma caninum]